MEQLVVGKPGHVSFDNLTKVFFQTAVVLYFVYYFPLCFLNVLCILSVCILCLSGCIYFSTNLLHSSRIIDQNPVSRFEQALGIAHQFFGCFISRRSW